MREKEGRGWARRAVVRSVDFKFPISRRVGCVENVACNVATYTRESERELHTLDTNPERREKKMTVERSDGRGRR